MTKEIDEIADIGEDFYLQHFGKMGMRWGHRNASSGSENTSTKGATAKKVAISVAKVTAISLGSIAAASVLAVAGAVKIASDEVNTPEYQEWSKGIKDLAAKQEARKNAGTGNEFHVGPEGPPSWLK